MAATFDLAGIGEAPLDGIDLDAEIEDRLRALQRYWDSGRPPRAYASDPPSARVGGERYYDDNAWVGLALVELERLRPGSGWLDRADELYRFALGGWAAERTPNPGGVFWVEQGRGIGARNHDRNVVSTAPNAALGLHLAELKASLSSGDDGVGAQQMYDWVLGTLDASRETDSPGTGLFWDKLRGDGTIDRALWSYNQGNMIGLNVLLARSTDGPAAPYIERAERIARKSLRHFSGAHDRQPAAFNAIFARNLLLLHDATADERLRAEMIDALRRYGDWAWEDRRDSRDRFHLDPGGVTLLNQSGIVQVLAMLAWDPVMYGRIA
jgi:predicted alpha-1,6-mannanase (GH76 family)